MGAIRRANGRSIPSASNSAGTFHSFTASAVSFGGRLRPILSRMIFPADRVDRVQQINLCEPVIETFRNRYFKVA